MSECRLILHLGTGQGLSQEQEQNLGIPGDQVGWGALGPPEPADNTPRAFSPSRVPDKHPGEAASHHRLLGGWPGLPHRCGRHCHRVQQVGGCPQPRPGLAGHLFNHS